jgi:hypothetical protein
MADTRAGPTEAGDPPSVIPSADDRESYGCFSIILRVIISCGMYKRFELAGPTGALGVGIASFGLAALGFGILDIGVKCLR